MSLPQTAKEHCTDYDKKTRHCLSWTVSYPPPATGLEGGQQMSGEEYLSRKYCQPKPYWRCLQELSGGNYYAYNEINFPEYWLDAVAKYIQQKPSAGAKQLHRRVEAARAEFRTKQGKAWGAGGVDRAKFDKKELSAWNTFNAQKQAYLKDYLRGTETGVVVRRRRGRKCKECKAEKVMGRAKYCEVCAKQRHREAVRANKKQSRSLGGDKFALRVPSTRSTCNGLKCRKGPFGYPKYQKPTFRHDAPVEPFLPAKDRARSRAQNPNQGNRLTT